MNSRLQRHSAPDGIRLHGLEEIAMDVEKQLPLPLPPVDLTQEDFFDRAARAEKEMEDSNLEADDSELNEEDERKEMRRAADGQLPKWLVLYGAR